MFFLCFGFVALSAEVAIGEVVGHEKVLDEIVGHLADFNQRMGIEPLPVSGGPDARFSRFEPQYGFMEHWGSALRVRWSIKLLSHRDGRVFVIYQYLMGFPDSPSTDSVETTVRLWFFERSKDGVYRTVLQEELMEASPLIFRFDERGALSVMDDRLNFVPYIWNGQQLVRK